MRRGRVRWTTRRDGRRRPRRHVVRRANVVLVGILVFYAAVAVAVIHGRNWRPARPCQGGPCGCGRVCADTAGSRNGQRPGAVPGDGRDTR